MRSNDKMIVITGAAGFIGSCLTKHLYNLGLNNLILVDDFGDITKAPNLSHTIGLRVERKSFFDWLVEAKRDIDMIFHLGARTDTTEFDYSIHEYWNLFYSQRIWDYCTRMEVPLIYASSAATYGDGAMGYEDDHKYIPHLEPLNPYGVSKNEFDKWVIKQRVVPPFWAGLKFFNVYGPNEYHKGRMASVVFHSFHQIMNEKKVSLFRSHKVGFDHGQQLRDFIYVKDILRVCCWLKEKRPDSGIYNLGTGIARTFNSLVLATFSSLNIEPNISYIDIPLDIREKYQYFTEANMKKLRNSGYDKDFFTLEDGILDYVTNYLIPCEQM